MPGHGPSRRITIKTKIKIPDVYSIIILIDKMWPKHRFINIRLPVKQVVKNVAKAQVYKCSSPCKASGKKCGQSTGL